MIKLIGTTHLMSKEEIESIIKLENPDVIGVELCNTRLNLMVINPPIQTIEQPKDESILGKITSAVKKKAEENKLEYGSDMVNASKYAINNKIPLVLVDMDIYEIRKLFEKLPENEKLGFMKELTEFETQSLAQEVDVDKTLNDLNIKFPIAFEFLITMRELYISNQILKAIKNYPDKNIIIFLGKGHINSIGKLI